jgi:hypothetical protein
MAQALESFGLNEGEKFAFLLLSNVYVDFPDGLPARLSDGTWVFDKYPTSADTYWEKLLGTLRFQEIQEANLVLARSRTADPHQLTIDDYKLGQSLADVHAFLQLGGVVEHKAASLVVGSMTSGAAFVRQVSGIEKYRTTRGYSREPVTSTRLEQAVCLASVYGNLFARPGSSVRFRRGLNILLDGLRQENGQERLHQFVRALEALVLPEVGNTKRHFVHRCQTFAVASPHSNNALGEAFDLRSDAEHVHEWNRSMRAASPEDAENIALWRTRQMERLACFAYSRVLTTPSIFRHFADDTTLADFWHTHDDATRVRLWGSRLDLSAIPIARKYDQWGRASL